MDAFEESEVTVTLDGDRALVLSDLLWRWGRGDASQPFPSQDCFQSPAEIRVLIDLLCDLEAGLVAPFRSDYDQLVERARSRLAEGWEDITLRI